MILLEDLQWAGTESLGLLSDLASRVADLPVLLVGAFRDDRPQSFREELPRAEYLYLNRLTAQDIAKRLADPNQVVQFYVGVQDRPE